MSFPLRAGSKKPSDGSVDAEHDTRERRGVLQRILWKSQDSGFVIAKFSDRPEAAKGTLREPAIGCEYHLVGKWKLDARYGWSFVFDAAEPIQPTDAAGIVSYLVAYAPQVGRSRAEAIIEKLGAEGALEMLRRRPEEVADRVNGITLERAKEISEALCAREEMERVEVDVRGICGGAGAMNSRQIRTVIETYGKEAAAVVRGNPYRLADEVDGVGWATADRIGHVVGIDPRDVNRVRAGILHVLGEAESAGNTCVARDALMSGASALLGVEREKVEEVAVDLAERGLPSGNGPDLAIHLEGRGPSAVEFFARLKTYENEATIAARVVELLRGEDEAKARRAMAWLDEHFADENEVPF